MRFKLSCIVTAIVLWSFVAISPIKAQEVKIVNLLPDEYQHRVYEHIVNISNYGVHSAGTIEEKKVAHYVKRELRDIGVKPKFEKFIFESYDIDQSKLLISNNNFEVLQVGFNPYTTEEFYYNEEFVLLDSTNATNSNITDKIIIASDPLKNMDFFSLFFQKPKLILVVSQDDHNKISMFEENNLTCEIIGKIKKHRSQNVVSTILAPIETKNEIIISAHYDSYPTSIGADDNASGVGALIELARFFKQQESELTSNIRFVFFGGEEKGLLGSRAYLNRHKDELDNCNLLFNMDQVGGANIFIETEGGVEGISSEKGMTQFPAYMRNRSLEGITSNWRILAPEAMKIFSINNRPEWLSEIIKQTTEELQITVSFAGNTGSDQMTFAQAGIVASAIGTSGNEYHSPLDTPSQINKQSLHDCGTIAAKVVFKTMDRFDKKKSININNKINSLEKNELMAHIRFLASDELIGRKPGTEGAKIAARYISEQFKAYNIKVFPNYPDYFQPAYLDKDEQSFKPVLCNNIVGYIEGFDPELKDEYILLMAHYDHLGVKKDLNNEDADSIYNGARDNGIGTTALIHSAKTLSKTKLKRSVILLATTGEEEGMLGSKYFVNHSPVPIEKIVFVLNNDGGGFNDTTLIRVGGMDKINYPFALWNEVEKLGIKSLPYPKELEYLYKLGDSITFANLGIPAITVSPGFDEIDDDLLKYVHQPEDEVDDNFNYSYLLKFSRVYQNIAMQIANEENLPMWKNEK